MPLFNNYNREPRIILTGNEPPKKGAALYFDLFTRKFWNYIKLNLLYVLTSIVTFAFYWMFMAVFILPMIFNSLPAGTFEELSKLNGSSVVEIQSSITLLLGAILSVLLIVFFGGGIFSAGYNYVLRNYARQENAFLFSDYLEHTKKNFWLAFFASLIDKIIVCISLFGIVFYFSLLKTKGGALPIAALIILILVFEIYAVMHAYTWTQIVTFKLNLKQIYKNAFLLSFAAGLRSIAYIVAMLGYTVLMFLFYIRFMPIAVIVTILIAISAFNLGGHLYSYPVIKKYMLDNNKDVTDNEQKDNITEGNEE